MSIHAHDPIPVPPERNWHAGLTSVAVSARTATVSLGSLRTLRLTPFGIAPA